MLTTRYADVMGVEPGDEPLVSVDGLRQHSVADGMVATHRKCSRIREWILVLGTARFIARRTTEIKTHDEISLVYPRAEVVINTLTMPAIPDLPGVT